ncbi:MAG: hypothetical protein DK841_01670 [Candidatus Melainabacteria bacterium]|nr:MAG: hypothetical protein DK841_01670 [Candidatus Melainabacteria bacterium]
MKKLAVYIFIILLGTFCFNVSAFSAEQKAASYPEDVDTQEILDDEYSPEDIDIEKMYRDLPVPNFKYMHNIDPGEYQDTMYSTWSPYPLFRLTAPLFFKTIAIEPGYYLLTPREHDGAWYILFKEAGKVKYIVPCYKKEMVPMDFYKNNLPQVKMTKVQLIREKFLKVVGKNVKSSKRQPIPDTYLEASDMDNNFISIIVYWGNYRYYFVLRSIQL